MLTKHYLFINSTIQECQYWKLRFNYTNEVYSLKMYCSCTHWHLGFHLLKTHDINKEGNCKFMEMQSWQYCPSCAFVENFFLQFSRTSFCRVNDIQFGLLVTSTLGFKAEVCMLNHPHAMDFSDLPPVQHLWLSKPSHFDPHTRTHVSIGGTRTRDECAL